MFEIVVLGSLNMDLVARVPHFPATGETVSAESFHRVPGGKGANQAVAIAKLGRRVALIGRVGDDEFGKELLKELSRQGISVDQITIDMDNPTGVAIVVVDSEGENQIVIVPGANGTCGLDDIDRSASILLEAKVFITQFETPLPTIEYALKGMKSPMTILNAAPVYPLDQCQQVISMVDILVINEVETLGLTGKNVDLAHDALEAGDWLLSLGPRAVIITLGAQGSVLVSENQREHIPARKVEVVDTTAAGDAFVGGLAAYLCHQDDLLAAVDYATVAAALTVTKFGAQPSLPSKEEVEKNLTLKKRER